MSRGYYNGGYNNTYEVDHHHHQQHQHPHRYEEIPDIDPSMDFLQADDVSASFYYIESPTRLLRGPAEVTAADPAERTSLLRGRQQSHNGQTQQRGRARQRTPPAMNDDNDDNGGGNDRQSTAEVTPCKARRRLDVYGDCTASLPATPSDMFAPMMTVAAKPVAVRRARSSAALYNKHKRPPEFLSEYNLDTCVPVTGVQYDRPRNTAVIQPIYKAPSSVFQVRRSKNHFRRNVLLRPTSKIRDNQYSGRVSSLISAARKPPSECKLRLGGGIIENVSLKTFVRSVVTGRTSRPFGKIRVISTGLGTFSRSSEPRYGYVYRAEPLATGRNRLDWRTSRRLLHRTIA